MIQRRNHLDKEAGGRHGNASLAAARSSRREVHVAASTASPSDPEPQHAQAVSAGVAAATVVATAEEAVLGLAVAHSLGESGANATLTIPEATHKASPGTELKAQVPRGGGAAALASTAASSTAADDSVLRALHQCEEDNLLVRTMDASMAVLAQYLLRSSSASEGRPTCSARGQNCATGCTCRLHETCYPSLAATALVQGNQNASGAALHRDEHLEQVKMGRCGWSLAAVSISSISMFLLLGCLTSCTRATLLAYADRAERLARAAAYGTPDMPVRFEASVGSSEHGSAVDSHAS